MRIVLTGGTGFLGSALVDRFLAEGHDVIVLTRRSRAAPGSVRLSYVAWKPDGSAGQWALSIGGADTIVNLAGESIAARRWSARQKEEIRSSRVLATRSLTTAIRQWSSPPKVFVSASAVGYYGDRGDETLTEASQPGSDFLASVCRDWEAAALEVAQITRVAIVRTGIPLDRTGGALAKMLPPFRFFVGGPLGSGRQYMPWIHKTDWLALVSWIVQTEAARGAINATAPTPVTNAEFSSALGHALHRPSLLPAPPFALKLLLGEMADALLLGGQRALPVRATDLGFRFQFREVDEALADVLRK